MRPVKFVVVGAGKAGSTFIKQIAKDGERLGIELSAIVEPEKEKSALLLNEFPENKRPLLLSNIGSLTKVPDAQRPEAAIVCVPARIQSEIALACLSKGMHCLVEKPLGFSAMDCRDLGEKAKSFKRHLQGSFPERWIFAELWNHWKPSKGVWTINAIRVNPFVPRSADMDVLHDLMIVDLDLFVLLNSIFHLPKISKVRAWGRKLRSSYTDYAIVALDLEDGGMARFFASRLSAETNRAWEMTGPNWHASFNFMRRTLKRFEQAGRDVSLFRAVQSRAELTDPVVYELEFFRRTIDQSVPVPENSPMDFADLSTLRAFPHNVYHTHEIVDEIMSCMKVFDGR
jgi:predicted dehydrogenase